MQIVSRLLTGQGTVVEACSASRSNLEAPLKKVPAVLIGAEGRHIYIYMYAHTFFNDVSTFDMSLQHQGATSSIGWQVL